MRALLKAAALSLAAFATVSAPAWADTTAPRSITVNGDMTRAIAQTASQAAVDATYQATIDDALDSTQAKAQSIANKLGATLGPVLTFVENYGYVSCPDGSVTPGATAGTPTAGGTSSPASGSSGPEGGSLRLPPLPPARHHKQHHAGRGHAMGKHSAADDTPICTVEANITVSYEIS